MNKTIRYITLGSLFLIPVFPLIVANSFFFPFITGKAFYFRILVEIAFSGWLILAFIDPKYRPRFTPLSIGITVFALVTLVADLFGLNPLRSIWSNFERMEGWITVIHLWAFFIVASSVFGSGEEGREWWHRWFNASLVVAAAVGIYGFAQLFGWAAIHQGSTRIDASLGNAIYMAVYMLFHSFLAAYLYFVERSKTPSSVFKLWLYAIFSVLAAFLLYETATRGTILGLLGGVLLSLGVYAVFGRHEPRRARYISAGIMVGILLICGLFWLNRDAKFIQDNEVMARLASISWNDTQTQARAYIWPMAISNTFSSAKTAVIGIGQENFNYIFNADYNPLMWRHEQWFDRAHNVYLDWLTASGLLGLLSYIALYVFGFIAILKSSLPFSQRSVLIGLLAGYAVHNVFVFDNLASYALFAALLAFVSSLKEGKQIRFLGSAPMRIDGVEYIVMPIVIIVLVAGVYFLNVRPIQANTRLISALQGCAAGKADTAAFDNALATGAYVAEQEVREQLLSCASTVVGGNYPNPFKQTFFDYTAGEIQKNIQSAPGDARAYALGGFFMNAVGQYKAALQLLDKAHALSPKKQSIMFQLAETELNLGEDDKAVALLKEAYEDDTTYDEAKAAYINALILSGKDGEARRLFPNDPYFETDRAASMYSTIKQYSKAEAIFLKLQAADPSNTDIQVKLAQVQYQAGELARSIATLEALSKAHPELKPQIDNTIKKIQAK